MLRIQNCPTWVFYHTEPIRVWSLKPPLCFLSFRCVFVTDSYRQSRSGAQRPGTVLTAVLEWLPYSLLAICTVWIVRVRGVSPGAANSPTSGVFTENASKCPSSLTRWSNLVGAPLQLLTGGKTASRENLLINVVSKEILSVLRSGRDEHICLQGHHHLNLA